MTGIIGLSILLMLMGFLLMVGVGIAAACGVYLVYKYHKDSASKDDNVVPKAWMLILGVFLIVMSVQTLVFFPILTVF